jgi:AcrR family transcriptional regulator
MRIGGVRMPKIIKDIEQKILTIAEELFTTYSYEEVDMRQIAKRVGIAVGTLYNYYPNKKQLHVKVFEYSWKNTFIQLDEVIASSKLPEEKLKMYIKELYQAVQRRNGLGRELFGKGALLESKDGDQNIKRGYFRLITERIQKDMEQLLVELYEQKQQNVEKDMRNRLAASIMILIFSILEQYPGEKEKNLEFLYQLMALNRPKEEAK